jgi:hypothetical protein
VINGRDAACHVSAEIFLPGNKSDDSVIFC